MKDTPNPNWTRDELILALNFYFRFRPSIPDKNSNEIGELSGLLNRLHGEEFKINPPKFRNRNGVHMKMMNFRRFDPSYKGSGLQRGGQLEKDVWNDFSNDLPRLRKTAEAIEAAVMAGAILGSEANAEDEAEAFEGSILTREHKIRERNQKLVKKKKETALKNHGKLECEICAFNFASVYGERGIGYIECHHTKPVSEIVVGQKTRVDDLILVCPNCHRMIHRKRPWLTKEELKQILFD